VSIAEAAKLARRIADTSVDPAAHRLAAALEAILLAESDTSTR
jgi:hypothetical protein